MPSWLTLLLELFGGDKKDEFLIDDLVGSPISPSSEPLKEAGDLTLSSSNTDSNIRFLGAKVLFLLGCGSVNNFFGIWPNSWI